MIRLRKNASDRQLIGTFFDIDSPLAMECVALSGMDFVIADTEHAPIGTALSVELICRAQLHGMPVLIRTADFSRPSVLKALDAGADGVIIPCIRSAEDAKQAVRFGKYKPVGDRGVAYTRACDYGCDPRIPDMTGLFAVKNAETALILQCETVGCLEQIEEIAAMEGVDGIFIGPFDLTSDLGLPGQFGHPVVRAAMKRVYDACRNAGKPVMIFSPTGEDMTRRLDEGYDAVAVSTVSGMIRTGCRQYLNPRGI